MVDEGGDDADLVDEVDELDDEESLALAASRKSLESLFNGS